MGIVSYSERKLTLEMTFRAKTDVTNEALNDVSTLRYAHPLSVFNYVHLGLMSVCFFRIKLIIAHTMVGQKALP